MVATLALALEVFYANAAGTINLSLSQQFDTQGRPLANCKLYFYQAGTVATPQNAYSDTNLTLTLPNPLSCDASGRIQQFFLADGQIKIRLTDVNGSEILVADNILVIGPSSGGGGGGSVDPTTIYQTADIKVRYGTGVHSGWVRGNGRTIGSATSGATERANSDTQALWEYLCTNDTVLRATISGGYSGSCANDFASNKTIQLPDYRGRAIAGLGDMGNSATTDLTTTYCGGGGDPTVLGQACGSQSTTITQSHLPALNLPVSGTVSVTTSTSVTMSPGGVTGGLLSANIVDGGGTLVIAAPATISASASSSSSASHSLVASTGGSSGAFSRIPPMRLLTIYVKL